MRRRDLALSLAGLAGLSLLPVDRLGAQEPDKLPKVAFLGPDTPDYAEHSTRPSVLLGADEVMW